MPRVLIAYDAESEDANKLTKLKNTLKERGYNDFVLNEDYQLSYLPNTTLVKSNTTIELVSEDFEQVIDELNIAITRFIATEIVNTIVLPGKSYAS